MAAPDSLPYLMNSHTKRLREREATRAAQKDYWPVITGVIWAALDCGSVIAAGLAAFRIRLDASESVGLEHTAGAFPPGMLFIYLLLYSFYLVIFGRTYGLYRPMEKRSGLNEQRMTVQASFTAGLLLCGTLYLLRAYAVSRIVMALTVVLTTLLIMARRAVWRKVQQRRFLEGIETRNVLIVGAGRVGQALRSHIEALPHMGYRFKGFVSMRASDREGETADSMVVGHIRNCVALARTLFADEIFLFHAGGSRNHDSDPGRSAVAGHRRTRGSGPVRRSGLERTGGVCRSVSHHSTAPQATAQERDPVETYAGRDSVPCRAAGCGAAHVVDRDAGAARFRRAGVL